MVRTNVAYTAVPAKTKVAWGRAKRENPALIPKVAELQECRSRGAIFSLSPGRVRAYRLFCTWARSRYCIQDSHLKAELTLARRSLWNGSRSRGRRACLLTSFAPQGGPRLAVDPSGTRLAGSGGWRCGKCQCLCGAKMRGREWWMAQSYRAKKLPSARFAWPRS